MKLICAPMATLSHAAFRIMIEKFGGCDEYFTEMINAPSLLNDGPFEKFYTENAPVPQKIVFQLTGREKTSMAEAARVLSQKECLGLDLNMGCCAPEIEKTGAGIAWMTKPIEETEDLVKSVKKAIEETNKNIRLSAKIRLGKENFTDDEFFSFCDMLISSGVEQITLHPRTRKEKYREKPRYIYAERLALLHKNIPIIVNGDVSDFSSFKKVLNLCPSCAGIMIGRAAVQKPWIFSLLKQKLNDENAKLEIDFLKLAQDFIKDVQLHQPPEFYKTRLQRFFNYYCNNFSFAHYAKTQLLNAKSVEETLARLEDYFQKVKEDRIKSVTI